MTLSKFLPVAAIVGILAALWIIVGVKFGLVLWVPFLSWALFFGAGAGKFSRVPKEVIGLLGGTIAAILVVWLLPVFTQYLGSFWALPALVFLAGFTIVMLELTNWFELAPAYFYSFAGFFAYLFGGFASTTTVNSQMVTMFVLLLLAGTALGVISGFLRKTVLNALGVPPEQQKTIFDKETI